MDWNSKEGRALLWQAYPEGYLAKRGVRTVGGWWCQHEIDGGDADQGAGIFACTSGRFTPARLWPDGVKDVVRLPTGACAAALTSGDLLPLPDPADAATWACLLADFAAAEGTVGAIEGDPIVGHCWSKVFGHDDRGWRMARVTRNGLAIQRGWWPLKTDDPAEALVRARASLRSRA